MPLPRNQQRHMVASLAHQRAGQVVALRDAARRIAAECTTVDQAVAVLRRESQRLERDITLMAVDVEAGHA